MPSCRTSNSCGFNWVLLVDVGVVDLKEDGSGATTKGMRGSVGREAVDVCEVGCVGIGAQAVVSFMGGKSHVCGYTVCVGAGSCSGIACGTTEVDCES